MIFAYHGTKLKANILNSILENNFQKVTKIVVVSSLPGFRDILVQIRSVAEPEL
jgi:hypothetical protein